VITITIQVDTIQVATTAPPGPPNHLYFAPRGPRTCLASCALVALLAALESPFFSTLSVKVVCQRGSGGYSSSFGGGGGGGSYGDDD
jgi:hypothetical protein